MSAINIQNDCYSLTIYFESVETAIWNESLMKFNNFLTRWPFDLSWFGSNAWALFRIEISKFLYIPHRRLQQRSTWIGYDCKHVDLGWKKSLLRDSETVVSENSNFCSNFLAWPKKNNSVWIDPVQHFWYWWRQKYLWEHLHICFELLLKPSCHLLFVQSQIHSLFWIAPPCDRLR